MMSPLEHVCNGLARPADESMLARDIGTQCKHNGVYCAYPTETEIMILMK